MSIINIDKDKKIQENEVRILEIRGLLPNLRMQIKSLELELRQLENINVFLSVVKSDV